METQESLTKVFDFVHQQGLLDSDIVGRLEDFYLFVPNFGNDLMSDLVASITKQELINFTKEQCQKHNIQATYKIKRPYWDVTNHKWGEVVDMVPEVYGAPIVLIPKSILVTDYLYNANH